ncbi:hypothetical protein AB4562_03930 [Vibrio sp. 10N.222.54.A1]
MNINELYRLSTWYEANVLERNFKQAIKALHANNNQLMTSPANTSFRDGFESQKEILLNLVSEVDRYALDFDDQNVLEKLNLRHILLDGAFDSLKSLLDTDDFHTISARLTNYIKAMDRADDIFKAYLSFLPNTFDLKHFESPPHHADKILTRVRFHNEASIDNVVNLSDWSDRWYTIARGYSMALGQAPEEFEVVGAANGSIVFDLQVALDVAKMLAETFALITATVASCLTIKDSIKAAQPFKESNKELYKQIVSESQKMYEAEQEQMASSVAEKLIKKFGTHSDGEKEVALSKSVRELYRFIDQGGDLAFKCSSSSLEHEEEARLVNEALFMLKNRNSQKQLEDKSK